MSDDEFHDPALGRALGGLAGPPGDVDTAYAAVRRGVRTARRRRAAAWTVTGGLAVGLMALAAAGLPGGDDTQRLVPAESLGTSTSVDRDVTTTPGSTIAVPGTTGPEPTTSPTQPAPQPAGTTGTTATAGTTDTTGTTGTTGTTRTTGTTATTTTMPTTSTSAPATTAPSGTTTPPAAVTKTCSSPGGSVTVRYSGSTFSIVSTDPEPGWELHEHETEDTRIKVKFEDGEDGQWVVQATWSNGSITCSAQPDA